MLVREVEVLKVCVTMGRPHSAEHELCPGDAAPRVCCAHGCLQMRLDAPGHWAVLEKLFGKVGTVPCGVLRCFLKRSVERKSREGSI